MAEEYKHDFVDDYPYIVYADEKILYTGDPDTPYVPGGGGGDGGINDVYVWNITQNSPNNTVIPESVKYWFGVIDAEDYMVFSNLEIENITCTFADTTIYGVKIKNAPLGCNIVLDFADNVTFEYFAAGYNLNSDYDAENTNFVEAYELEPESGIMALPNLKPIQYENSEYFYTMFIYEISSIS